MFHRMFHRLFHRISRRRRLFPATDFTNAGFPFGTSQELHCGAAAGVRALRISFVGELGWELHCPAAQASTSFWCMPTANAEG